MFYSQQNLTDCGVVGVENMLQLPRSLLPPVKNYKSIEGDLYSSYKWVAETLSIYGKFKCDLFIFDSIPLLNEISILGVQLCGRPTWHCIYQYYDKFWCGYEKDFIDINFCENFLWEKNDAVIMYKITKNCVEDLEKLYYLHDAILIKHKNFIVGEV